MNSQIERMMHARAMAGGGEPNCCRRTFWDAYFSKLVGIRWISLNQTSTRPYAYQLIYPGLMRTLNSGEVISISSLALLKVRLRIFRQIILN